MKKKISELKEKHHGGYVTTERFLNIDETPGDTCPFIDETISSIDNALSALKSDDVDDIKYWVEYYLDGLESVLEDARTNVEKIRSWGQQYKDELKRVIELGAHKYYE